VKKLCKLINISEDIDKVQQLTFLAHPVQSNSHESTLAQVTIKRFRTSNKL